MARPLRPDAPVVHSDEVEHRRLLAVKANAALSKDGTDGMTAPLKLMSFDAADLVGDFAASLWEGAYVYVGDEGVPAYSDGSTWQRLALETDVAALSPVEGSWTPVLSFGGSSTGVTYSTQVGSYIKTGNLVTVWASIVLTNNGSGTGSAALAGLPFTASTITGLNFVGTFGSWNNISTDALGFHSVVDSGASSIKLSKWNGAGSDASTGLTDADIDSDASFNVSVTYRTG